MKSRQEKKYGKSVFIGAMVGIGLIGFMYLGLPQILPPASMQAHNERVYSHFHVMVDTDQIIPANIGIDEALWNYHELDSLGVSGYAPIHTHDNSGAFHIETKERHDFMLGDLAAIWGVEIKSACLKTVSEFCTPLDDPESIVLRDGDRFRLEVES
jgi:hypothetical protein